MWIKKINEFFNNISEYDNTSLSLHFAVDFIDMMKERLTFKLDDDCNLNILILSYKEVKEDIEVDNEGLLNWLHFTFHKELIDIILSLKTKFDGIENTMKELVNQSKVEPDKEKQAKLNNDLEKNSKELDTLKMILSRVDTYRRNTFNYLRDKDNIDHLITHIRIYKEQNE